MTESECFSCWGLAELLHLGDLIFISPWLLLHYPRPRLPWLPTSASLLSHGTFAWKRHPLETGSKCDLVHMVSGYDQENTATLCSPCMHSYKTQRKEVSWWDCLIHSFLLPAIASVFLVTSFLLLKKIRLLQGGVVLKCSGFNILWSSMQNIPRHCLFLSHAGSVTHELITSEILCLRIQVTLLTGSILWTQA